MGVAGALSLRIRRTAGVVSWLGVLFASILFLAALFSRMHVLGTAALLALIASVLAIAVVEAWQAYALFDLGRWTTLGKKQASRAEQPGWFWAHVSMHLGLAAICGGAAGYLTWALIAYQL